MTGKRILICITIVFISIGCSIDNNDELPSANRGEQKESDITLPTEYDSLKNVSVFQSDTTPPFDVSLTKETSFKGHPLNGSAGKVLVGRTGQFAVDRSNKVYSVHGHNIHVFDSRGEYLTTLGGDGRGPGEFRNMTATKPIIKSGRLYAYDDVLRRLNIFDTQSLELAKTILIDPGIWGGVPGLQRSELRDYFIYSDSLLLMKFQDTAHRNSEEPYYNRYYLIDIKNETVSGEIFKHRLDEEKSPFIIRSNGRTDWPFPNASGRYMQVAIGPDNHIYATRTEDFLIKVYSPKGEYLRAIYYPYVNIPLDKQDIIDSYTQKTFIERAEEHEYPETWPAIDRFFVDDEKRIWVATITEDENRYEWWILENSGKLMAKFRWPGQRVDRHDSFRVLPKVRNGFFYDKQTDSTSGISELVKYRINFKEL